MSAKLHSLSPGDVGSFRWETMLFETMTNVYDPVCTAPAGSIFIVCAIGFSGMSKLVPGVPCYMLLTPAGIGWIAGHPGLDMNIIHRVK